MSIRPVSASVDPAGHPAARPADLALASGRRVGTSLLIVEDDPVDQAILLRNIGRSRFMDARSVCVASLKEAKEALGRETFDFVILDFWVQGVSSLPLLDLISRRFAMTVPIIITSIDFTDVQGLGLSFGALGYLHKSDLSASALDSVMRTGASQRARTFNALPVA